MFIENPEYNPRKPSFFTILLVTQKIFSLRKSANGFSYTIRTLITSIGYEAVEAATLAKAVLAIRYFELNYVA